MTIKNRSVLRLMAVGLLFPALALGATGCEVDDIDDIDDPNENAIPAPNDENAMEP